MFVKNGGYVCMYVYIKIHIIYIYIYIHILYMHIYIIYIHTQRLLIYIYIFVNIYCNHSPENHILLCIISIIIFSG